ncbi:MAG: hypothetical protein Q4D06_01585 [Coriobacteriia bacterium]|nr:hypothetical protein [Coriobacteriia bacterium]
MEAPSEQISLLLNLQQVDMTYLQTKKRFEELPQRAQILQIRQKQDEIAKKAQQVLAMREQAEKKIAGIEDEDQRLAEKIASIQKAIDEGTGDYRNLEAATKEMNGQTARREELVAELEVANANLEKVLAVARQVAAASDKLGQQENAAIESFRKEGTDLQQQMARLEAERKEVEALVEPGLLEEFRKTAKACAGVGIGVLSEDRCGICRQPIQESRMVELRSQAPLGRCPHCKRMLVVL